LVVALPTPKLLSTAVPTEEPIDLSRYEMVMLALQDVVREYSVGNLTVNRHAPLPTPPLEAIARPITREDFGRDYWVEVNSIGSWNTDDQYYYDQDAKRLDKWEEGVVTHALGEPEGNQFVLYVKPVRFYEYVMPYLDLMFGDSEDGSHCIPEEIGFALLDLDEDGQEELILLATMEPLIWDWYNDDGTPYLEQDEPYWIFGVFTIKNDALFCVMRSTDGGFYRLGKNGKIYCSFGTSTMGGRARLHMRPSDGRLVVEEFWHADNGIVYVNDKMDLQWLSWDDDRPDYSAFYDWSRIEFVSIGTWIVVGGRDYCNMYSGDNDSNGGWDYFVPNEDWRVFGG